MTFPGDNVMLALLALDTGERMGTAGGGLTLTLPDRPGGQPVPASVLDELESLGWVEVVGDGAGEVRPTERGRYALAKWMAARMRHRYGPGRYVVTRAAVRSATSAGD